MASVSVTSNQTIDKVRPTHSMPFILYSFLTCMHDVVVWLKSKRVLYRTRPVWIRLPVLPVSPLISIGNAFGKKKSRKKSPDVGLEPTTLGLRVPCSTD